MKEGLIRIQEIMDEIYDESPKLRGLNLDTVVRHANRFMKIVGVPNMFIRKTAVLNIDCHRAVLPCDFYKIIAVRSGCLNKDIVYHNATDTFFLSDRKEKYTGFTYTIQNSVIFTSTENDPIEISYLAIPVDEDGFPMLPDNESFKRALIAYIKKVAFTSLVEQGKMDVRILQIAQQDYAWAVGDCATEFNRMSIDEAESFYNGFNELFVRANEHAKHFVNSGEKEITKIH